MYTTILLEQDGPVLIIRLNRPERMNAVIEAMYQELIDAMAVAEYDETVRCLVITGSVLRRGDMVKQAFCAGADIKKHTRLDRTLEQQREYIELAHRATKRVFEFPKPTVAAVNGPARGAGAELALNCDFMIIAEEADLGFPETGLGTFVGGGVTSHLVRLAGLMRAKELIYTGRVLSGSETVHYGLALEAVPSTELMDRVMVLTRRLTGQAPLSLMHAKKILQCPEADIGAVLQSETEAILTCMRTEDWREGLMAINEKRTAIFKGH